MRNTLQGSGMICTSSVSEAKRQHLLWWVRQQFTLWCLTLLVLRKPESFIKSVVQCGGGVPFRDRFKSSTSLANASFCTSSLELSVMWSLPFIWLFLLVQRDIIWIQPLNIPISHPFNHSATAEKTLSVWYNSL